MKVILLQDVKALGKKNDLVDVADGYAKNGLINKKLAVEATPKALNDLKLKKQNNDKVAAENLANAKKISEDLKDKTVTLKIKCGEGGKTFGSVTGKEIAEEVKKQLGIEVDKKKIVLQEAIKSVGSYDVTYKVHPEVSATIKVKVEEL
ncbi:MAG: 50S ribosomal protein L9 [Lachnospiraceae bacterium]|nr:50S ribosomal protein L9 [Lachnospiraceae bacterium]